MYPNRNRSGSPRSLAAMRLGLAAIAALTLTPAAAAAKAAVGAETPARSADATHFRYLTVRGIRIFYREAGDPTKPTILLLHGFPASSHEFRDLIPLLSRRFHVVAPDYPGFGLSDAPPPAAFRATFADLAKVMEGFVSAAGIRRYTIYMHDFGGPVGFRLATAHPEMVEGLVVQNANAYEEGIAPDVLRDMRERARGPLDAAGSASLERMLSPDGTRFQYLTGAPDPSRVDPTSYGLDSSLQAVPDRHRIQRSLIVDYADNVRLYPEWQAYLRRYRPRTLIVWGRNDPIFLPAGASAYLADLPRAEVRMIDAGHFTLEEDAPEIGRLILAFHPR